MLEVRRTPAELPRRGHPARRSCCSGCRRPTMSTRWRRPSSTRSSPAKPTCRGSMPTSCGRSRLRCRSSSSRAPSYRCSSPTRHAASILGGGRAPSTSTGRSTRPRSATGSSSMRAGAATATRRRAFPRRVRLLARARADRGARQRREHRLGAGARAGRVYARRRPPLDDRSGAEAESTMTVFSLLPGE